MSENEKTKPYLIRLDKTNTYSFDICSVFMGSIYYEIFIHKFVALRVI